MPTSANIFAAKSHETFSLFDELAAMVKAAVRAGIKIFEPTGGITVDNVYNIVKICLDNGAEVVIPHLYTSLINKETGKTEVAKIIHLLKIKWD